MRKFNVCTLLVMLLLSNAGQANSDVERDALKRVVKELELVESMLTEAERYKKPGEPDQFVYDDAKHDVRLLISGIKSHLNGEFNALYKREPFRLETKGQY
ncbi:hypothetical protein AB9X29_003728 [Vibrio vulnificus]